MDSVTLPHQTSRMCWAQSEPEFRGLNSCFPCCVVTGLVCVRVWCRADLRALFIVQNNLNFCSQSDLIHQLSLRPFNFSYVRIALKLQLLRLEIGMLTYFCNGLIAL